jgi:hypothetical protein
MTRFAAPAVVLSILVAGLAVLAIVLGINLLPTRMEALDKGTFAPWVIVWAMIVLTDVCALALAVFLFNWGMKGLSSEKKPAART